MAECWLFFIKMIFTGIFIRVSQSQGSKSKEGSIDVGLAGAVAFSLCFLMKLFSVFNRYSLF